MKLLTVIVNYRTAEHVLSALDALVPQLREQGNAEAWVVDNKSPDDSLRILREGLLARDFGSLVTLLESPVNGGFGAGNNVAIRRALTLPEPPEYIYLLNPDATPDPGAIEAIVQFMDAHPKVGVGGTFIHDPDGTPHCSTFRYPSVLSEIENGMRLGVLSRLLAEHTVYMDVPAHSGPTDWVSGASVVFRRTALEQVGLFDETFFLYFEEVDLCHRAKKAGWDVWFIREASVGHVGSVSTGIGRDRRTPRYWFDSRRHYLRKHHGSLYLLLANTAWAASLAAQRTRWVLQRKGAFEQPHLLKDLLRHHFLNR